MNWWHLLLVVTLPGLATMPVLAVNKCVDANGRLSYQNGPCPAHTHGGAMNLNVNRSFAGQSVAPVEVNSKSRMLEPAQGVDAVVKPRGVAVPEP